MTAVNEDRKRTAYAVSVDARDGIDTGISAADRARTIRVLVDSATEPYELDPAGARVPAARRRRRRPAPDRAHRGLGRPGPAGRADPRGRRRRGGQRRRVDVPAARAAPVRRRARPGAGVDRGPGHLPPTYRDARGAGRRGPAADPVRRVPGGRLPQHGGRGGAHGPGAGRDRHRHRCPGAAALGVPHRGRARLAALRLRATAGGRAADGGRGGPGCRGLPARPRGAGDRAAAQARRLPAAGRGARHRGRQPRPRAARRCARLQRRRADPRRPRRHVGAAAHQQPGQAGGRRGARADRRWSRCRWRCT